MAFTNRLESLTLEAAADFSAHQYKIVELASDGKAALAAAGEGFGILQNHPQSGEAGTIGVGGESKFIAGGTVSIGDVLRVGSGGWGISVASGAAHPANFWAIGRAMESVASGGIGTVHIDRQRFTGVASGAAF